MWDRTGAPAREKSDHAEGHSNYTGWLAIRGGVSVRIEGQDGPKRGEEQTQNTRIILAARRANHLREIKERHNPYVSAYRGWLTYFGDLSSFMTLKLAVAVFWHICSQISYHFST